MPCAILRSSSSKTTGTDQLQCICFSRIQSGDVNIIFTGILCAVVIPAAFQYQIRYYSTVGAYVVNTQPVAASVLTTWLAAIGPYALNHPGTAVATVLEKFTRNILLSVAADTVTVASSLIVVPVLVVIVKR